MAGVKRPFSEVETQDSARQLSIHTQVQAELQHGARASFSGAKPIGSAAKVSPPGDDAESSPRTPEPFEPDASIVLIGMRGTGKSTLAIIASTAMSRRLLDSEKAFQQATSFSSSTYKRIYGTGECHRRQSDVLQDMLSSNGKGSIIVCSWMEKQIHHLLHDFCQTNPVIHILRERQEVQNHLKIADEALARNLVAVSTTMFRSCSNFEFFNLSEDPSKLRSHDVPSGSLSSLPRSPAPYLTLKRAERHFLKFLTLIMPAGSIPFIESAFPLASVPTEERRFTYALSVTLSSLLTRDVDIEELEIGADALEVVIDDLAHTRGNPGQDTASKKSLDSQRASEITRVLGDIRRKTVIPLIYHVVRPATRHAFSSVTSQYLEYVRHGLRLAPEFITLDLELEDSQLSQLVSLRQRSKIIGHSSPEDGPPWNHLDWVDTYNRARSFGCSLVRLIKPATSMQDNFDVALFRSSADGPGEPRIPIIAYNSGLMGRHSACFNQILTSVAPNMRAAASEESDPTRPQLTAFDATTALYSSFVFDPMKLYVIGAMVSYSLSPAMHNAALAAYGIRHTYSPFSTPTLGGIRELVEDPHFAGASIGLPFKVEVITLTHSLSRHASAIGAVNTLIPVRSLDPDGSIPDDAALFGSRNRAGPVRALYGENTDWIGIRACIRRGLSPANAVRPRSCGLVIGAGGMGRAAVYAMLQLGVKNVVVFNRTPANAQKLVAHFEQLLARDALPLLSDRRSSSSSASSASSPAPKGGVRDRDDNHPTRFHVVASLADAWPGGCSLPTMIVSCIPTHRIGDVPAPDFTLPEPWLANPTGGVFFELEYKTLDSPLLQQLRRESHRGWVTMDGLDLLPEQGFAQFELFTGRRAPRRLMRREALRAWTDELGRSNVPRLEPRLKSIVEQEP